MNHRALIIIIILSLAMFSPLVPQIARRASSSGAPRTWIVDDDGPADFHTIQEAINAASDGDAIFVRNGTYHENVIVNKKLSLVGEDKTSTVIDGNASGNVVLMTSAAYTANISSFTLRNGRGINNGAGIDIRGSSNHTIADNIIIDNEFGLRLYPSHYNMIYGNEITSNLETGIELRSSRANSIFNNTASENGFNMWIIGSTGNNIANNSVTDGGRGISLDESPNSVLRNNRISNNYFNLDVWGKGAWDYVQDIDASNRVNGKTLYFLVNRENWQIDSSTFPDVGYLGLVNCKNMSVRDMALGNNLAGILLANTSGSVLENLRIDQASTGIDLEFGSNNNTVRNNTVFWSEMAGIYLNECCNNSICHNQVTCLNSAIRTVGSSNYNLIYHNTLIQFNPFQISLSSTNSWDDGYPSGGNYWSDFAGADVFSGPYQNETGSDGIGDTPYIIEVNNQDNYPLIHPYGSVVNLNTSLTYLTIQSAINAPETLSGHTILVEPGTYIEQLTVNKTLSIIGSGSESTTISGSSFDCAVEIAADNVELSGFTIRGGGFGLKVYSHNNNVHDNSIVENGFIGVYLYLSSGNTFTSNSISRNGYGMSLVHSGGNTFKSNLIFDNEWQELVVEGNAVSNFVEDMDISNSVDGKPVYYWVNQQDKIIPSDAGYVALVECRRILVHNLTFTRNGQGVLLAGTTDSTIENNTLSAEYHGIYMVDSSNVTIRNCTIANCNFAMEIWYSSGNKIIGNNIVSNAYGIEFAWSNYNNVSRNTIQQTSEYNGWGICLSVSATGNRIYENDFAHNSQGINIQLFYPGENKMYHNNFIQNAIQVYSYEPAISVWDDGYPSGGNYWDDYIGNDVYSGPHQNSTGSDGKGDIPYIIDANNVDHYPLIGPYVVKCADFNDDGFVNAKDVVILGFAFGSTPEMDNWNERADLDCNLIINAKDAVLLGAYFGQSLF